MRLDSDISLVPLTLKRIKAYLDIRNVYIADILVFISKR